MHGTKHTPYPMPQLPVFLSDTAQTVPYVIGASILPILCLIGICGTAGAIRQKGVNRKSLIGLLAALVGWEIVLIFGTVLQFVGVAAIPQPFAALAFGLMLL